MNIGDVFKNNQGLYAKIIDIVSSREIYVEFEDGVVVKTRSDRLKKGEFRNRKYEKASKIGERICTKHGLWCEIIEYLGNKDVTVKFDDGYVTKTTYQSFQQGSVKYKNRKYCDREYPYRIGDKIINLNTNIEIELVDYRRHDDIDVKIGGKLVTHVSRNFMRDDFVIPTKYLENILSKKSVKNGGMKMTLKEYLSTDNIIIEFEDGTLVRSSISKFNNDIIQHPLYTKYGTIFKYGKYYTPIPNKILSYDDIVELHFYLKQYSKIKHEDLFIMYEKNREKKREMLRVEPCNKYMNRRNTSTHGYTLEIVGYRNCNDIDVKIIETDEIRYNTYLSMFNKGTINPIHISKKYLKEDYINKKFTNSIGLEFIIVEWNKNDDILVKFTLDGFQKRVTINDIIKGHVRNDNYTPDLYRAKLRRLGQEKINSQGLKMKIIEYNHAQDIVVEFEDGYRIKTMCTSFDKGIIVNPNYRLPKNLYKEREGLVFYIKRIGMSGKIIQYNRGNDVLFEWEDGEVVKTTYSKILKGTIYHPKSMYRYNQSFFVYIFYSESGKVMYVGQTLDLWKRMRGHFWSTSNIEKNHPNFKSTIFRVEYCICSDYEEMMSLEYNLITEFNPIYNIEYRKPRVMNFTTKTFKDCEWIVYDDFEIIKQKLNKINNESI